MSCWPRSLRSWMPSWRLDFIAIPLFNGGERWCGDRTISYVHHCHSRRTGLGSWSSPLDTTLVWPSVSLSQPPPPTRAPIVLWATKSKMHSGMLPATYAESTYEARDLFSSQQGCNDNMYRGDEEGDGGTETRTNLVDRGGLWHINDQTLCCHGI